MNKLAVAWTMLLLGNIVLLLASIRSMMALEYYQFLPVIFIAESLLIYFRWDRKWRAPTTRMAITLLAAGLIAACAAIFFFSPRWATLSFILISGSWFLSHYEGEGRATLITLWPPLWLFFRIPSEAESGLVFGLQQASSFLASSSLDLLGVIHHRQGNIIDLPAGTLFVEEACSGVQSVFTLLFCALFLIPLYHRSVWLVPFYVIAGAIWAMVLNLFRIVAIAVALDWYGMDLSKGWQHEVLGYFCLTLAIGMLLTTDRLLAVLFFPTPATNIPFGGVNPLNTVWNKLFAVNLGQLPEVDQGASNHKAAMRSNKSESISPVLSSTAIVFSLVVISLQSWILAREGAIQSQASLTATWRPSNNPFKSITGLEVISHKQVEGSIDMPFGQLSDVWECRFNQIPIQIAFSQPYPEWHDLRVCYRASAWRLMDSEEFLSAGGNEEWSAVQGELMDSKNRFGYVFFSGLALGSGEPLSVPPTGVLPALGRMIDKNISKRFGLHTERAAMVQLFITADGKMSRTLQEGLQKLHFETRSVLQAELKSALGN